MPEHELLNPDLQTASRWRSLKERLDQGDVLLDLFPEIEKEFYRCLRAVFKQWRDCGADPAQLFAAAVNDRVALARLVQQARRHDYARLLLDVAATERDADLGRVVRSWLDLAWDSARTQLQVDRHGEGRRGAFPERTSRMLDRLSSRITADPSRIPRCPAGSKPLDVDGFLAIPLHNSEVAPR